MNILVIFLDIDGVLNCADNMKTTDKINGCLGINDLNLLNLQKLKFLTDAKIVLTSTWKLDYKQKNDLGKYLINKLNEYNLKIDDCTVDNIYDRGRGITEYLNKHPYIENFVILDDDLFNDYKTFDLLDNLIKTDFCKGLTEEKMKEALKILQRKEN